MRTKLICALLALCLFCSGCSVMDLDTQNLMSPPKATGDKADIQRVIEESAGIYDRQIESDRFEKRITLRFCF